MVGVLLDITDAKEFESALKRSEDKFKLIFNSTYDMILLHDEQGRIVDANEVFLKTYDTSLEDAIGMNISEISADSAPVERAPEIWGNVMRGIPQLFEWRARSVHRQREFDVEVFLQPVEVEGKKLILANVRDITPRKQAEAELRESEERFRTLANNMSQGAWMADKNGRIFWYNQRWLDYTGSTLEQMQGWAWVDTIHPEHRDRVLQSVGRCLKSGQDWEETFPIRGSNGTYRWFLSRAVPIRDAQGTVFRWFGTNTDITPQRETEEALRLANQHLQQLADTLARSNRDLERFSYVASHDLQEPLRQISGFVGLLHKRYGELFNQEAREYFDYIVEGATRAQMLINDLLAFSRIDKAEQSFVEVDLQKIVQAALRNVQLNISENKAQITVGPLPTVRGNPSSLLQVFQNLIANALKFKKNEPAEIAIEARRQRGEWLISVHDNGIGFSPEDAERIFQLFHRLHARGKYGGTGIGLAICRRAIELHGGRMWAESKPGEGATFYFTLPT